MKKRTKFILSLFFILVAFSKQLVADHFMGGSLSYQTVDIDSQRSIFNVILKLERPCSSLNKFQRSFPIKVLEYSSSSSPGYHMSIYSANLYDSTYIYFPCSSASTTCSNSNGQVIEVKYYKAKIVVQNTDKECVLYFDNNATRTYSDNIVNSDIPLILYNSFIPKYINTSYHFEEVDRHFPIKDKLTSIQYQSSDPENDSVFVESSIPYKDFSHLITNGNLQYTLTKAAAKFGLHDAKPIFMNESSLNIANNSIQFTPNQVQSSWLTLIKSEYRKISINAKDTWILVSKSNSDRLISVYDLNSQFGLHSVESMDPQVKLVNDSITICNTGNTSEIKFKLPIERSISIKEAKMKLGLQDISSTFTTNRIYSASIDTILLSLNYNAADNLDMNSNLLLDFKLCQSSSGIGFKKIISIPFQVFNSTIFEEDTILSCSNSIHIPLGTNKGIYSNWGTSQTSPPTLYISNPKDSLIIADLVHTNAYCPSKDSIYLNHGSVFSLNTVGYQPSCYGYADASAKVDVIGTNDPYIYRWTNNSTHDSIGSIKAGIHIVAVTDKDMCIQYDTIEIGEPTGINADWIMDSSITCFGGSDGRGHFQINSSILPTSYSWDDFTVPDSFLTNLHSDTFKGKFHYTNSLSISCQQDFEIFIKEPDTIFLEIVVTDNTCYGEANGKVAVIPRGGHENYQFNFNGIPSNTGFKSNLSNQTLSVFVTDGKGCSTSMYQVSVSSPNKLNYKVIAQNPSCAEVSNGSLKLNDPEGGTSPYLFSFDNATYNPNTIYSNLSSGVYNLKMQDANNCIFSQNLALNPAYTLHAKLENLEDSKCPLSKSGKIDLTMTNGDLPYKVFINSDSQLYYIQAMSFENLDKGAYSFLIKDNNGCSWSGNYDIDEPNEFIIDATVKGESCYNKNDGEISVNNITGGTSPYQSIKWFNSANDLIANSKNLEPGDYSLRFEDANNCSYEKKYTVVSKQEFNVALQIAQPISCHGEKNGKIIAITSGGIQPLRYNWKSQPSINTNQLIDIPAGTYELEVFDFDNCKTNTSVTLLEPKPIVLEDLKVKNTDCKNMNTGAITILCSGTSPNLEYQLKNQTEFGLNNNFASLAEGHYTVIVKDINACIKEFPTEIKVDKHLDLSLAPNMNFELGETEKITPNISFGANTSSSDIVSALWTPQTGLSCGDCIQPDYTAVQSGTYTLELNYGNGCRAIASSKFNVSNPEDVFIPNSFSPNGDEKNDIWKVYGKNIQHIDVKLINRVGELVFQSNDINVGWNGLFNGKYASAGAYKYFVKTTYADGSVKAYEGSLNLFR